KAALNNSTRLWFAKRFISPLDQSRRGPTQPDLRLKAWLEERNCAGYPAAVHLGRHHHPSAEVAAPRHQECQPAAVASLEHSSHPDADHACHAVWAASRTLD